MKEHPMRRSRQSLDGKAIEEILENGTSGTLALIDEEGLPYACLFAWAWRAIGCCWADWPGGKRAGCWPLAAFIPCFGCAGSPFLPEKNKG